MTINLGSTATDKTVSLKPRVKILMLISAAVMFLVEVSIVIEKHQATHLCMPYSPCWARGSLFCSS